jgi:hypothetical protein
VRPFAKVFVAHSWSTILTLIRPKPDPFVFPPPSSKIFVFSQPEQAVMVLDICFAQSSFPSRRDPSRGKRGESSMSIMPKRMLRK